MKTLFRLGLKLGLKLVHHLQPYFRVNPRIFFTVSLSIAAPFSGQNLVLTQATEPAIAATQADAQIQATLPEIQYKTTPRRSSVGTVFAYSSSMDQTDANPTITASGLNVGDGTLATNCLPFGTKVRFPTLYGSKEFTVTDRMAPRHGCNSYDIWQESLSEAKQFGRQIALVEVY